MERSGYMYGLLIFIFFIILILVYCLKSNKVFTNMKKYEGFKTLLFSGVLILIGILLKIISQI